MGTASDLIREGDLSAHARVATADHVPPPDQSVTAIAHPGRRAAAPPSSGSRWNTEQKNTFPVAYRKNTQGHLAAMIGAEKSEESRFMDLVDCRTLRRYLIPHFLELRLWRSRRFMGLGYPENCLLGVYRRRDPGDAGLAEEIFGAGDRLYREGRA